MSINNYRFSNLNDIIITFKHYKVFNKIIHQTKIYSKICEPQISKYR